MAALLHQAGYSLQANAKTTQGNQHSDRDAQFRHINTMEGCHRKTGDPVINVDTRRRNSSGTPPATKGGY